MTGRDILRSQGRSFPNFSCSTGEHQSRAQLDSLDVREPVPLQRARSRRLAKRDLPCLDVRREAIDEFNARLETALAATAWAVAGEAGIRTAAESPTTPLIDGYYWWKTRQIERAEYLRCRAKKRG